MRRKVNTRLLLWTLSGLFVVGVAVAIIHDVQFRRNVDVFHRQAEQALRENKLFQAAYYLQQYLAYQPDDTPALIQYAKTLNKIADSPSTQYRALLVLEQAIRRAPKDANLREETARLALELDRYAEAAAHFATLVQASPKNAQLWQDLGWCQESDEKFEQAEASYRKSIALNPKLLESYAKLANLLLQLDRSSDVPPVLAEMIEANPDSVPALLARAQYLQAAGDPDQAAQDIEQAYQTAPEQLPVILARANLEEKKGQWDKARTTLKKGLTLHPASNPLFQALVRIELKAGQPAQAAHWLEQELKQRPQDLAIRFQLFDLALGQGDRDMAEKVLADLKKSEGDKGFLWRQAEAVLLITFAGPSDMAPLQLARQRLNEVKKSQPAWNQPLLLEGLIEETTGNKNQAIQLYQQAGKLGPVSPVFLYRLADLLYQKQEFQQAGAALDKIETQSKLTPEQAKLAATVALRLGDFPRAVVLAHQAIPPDARDYRDRLWQAKLFTLAGYPEQAETVLRDLAKKSPSVPEVWIALVQRLVLSGKKSEAAVVLPQLPKHLPALKVKATLARCHEALGELAQAEKLLTESVSLQPHTFIGWKQLAEFYLRHKQNAQAEPWLRKLLDPDHRVPPELVLPARRQLAVALARQHDTAKYHEALTLLNAAGKTQPKSPDDAMALAQVLACKTAQRPEAIQMLEQARKQQPLPPEAAFALAVLYRQDGQPAKGAALLKTLLATEGETPDYLAEYVHCLLNQHDLGGVQFYLDRLQQLQPSHPRLPQLLLLLKKVQPPTKG